MQVFDKENKITYCTRCLYPSNHPLHLAFNAKGVCTGCLVHDEKDNYDWQYGLAQLKEITSAYQKENDYDCIIPVSGGRDAYFIVHFVKYVLGLRPLLVSYNRHYNTGLGIRNLECLRTRLGCDIVTSTISPSKLKCITQNTLKLLGSIHWAYLAGSTVFPVQTAVKRKIPLIIWGAHQGIDQVGMFFHKDQVEMTRRYRREHDLMGFEAEDLVNMMPDLTEELLSSFFYPTDADLKRVGVRGIYLNNFIYWDTKKQHEAMIKMYGYKPYTLNRTFDSYNDIDCQYYTDVHDYIKYLKFGFSKVTDHACREIRLGRLTRDEALKLEVYFQNKPIQHLKKVTDWLEISMQEFDESMQAFVAKKEPNKVAHLEKLNIAPQGEINHILDKLNFLSNENPEIHRLSQSEQLLLRGWASQADSVEPHYE